MSISTFDGNTFVAFLDISGFKQMMGDRYRVSVVLEKFYGSLFNEVGHFNKPNKKIKINVIAISDSAIIFLSKGKRSNISKKTGLSMMLSFISELNKKFVNPNFAYPFLTVCSIAYGDFFYWNRRERNRMTKNCLRGEAYLKAYLDTEDERNKLKPGQCRIVKDGLIVNLLKLNYILRDENEHIYFRWAIPNDRFIEQFDRKYNAAYERLDYDELVELHSNSIQPTSI